MTQARILDGKRIADEALHAMKAEVDARVAAGKRRPGLAVVLVGDDPASQSYVRNKRRAAGIVGIQTFDHNLAETTEDEKYLFLTVSEGTSGNELYVKDLASGTDRKVYDALDQDVQETWAVTGVYPNMAWTRDSSDVIFWVGGKLRRVAGTGGDARVIPFTIDERGVRVLE